MNKNKKNKKGFTLVELLTVISIIALLSSVVYSSLQSAKAKARDAVRIAGIKEIQTALELYYQDHGEYPGTNSGQYYFSLSYDTANEPTLGCGYYISWSSPPFGAWCGLEVALLPYLKTLPRDPLGSKQSSFYFTYKYIYPFIKPAGINEYGLSVILENSNSIAQNDGGYYSNWYEVGGLPTYCKNKYSGSNGNWNYWSYTAECVGGN
jgi:prepilin-type N-terminal cleavage/methylation domain-containing protein